jgi:diguanylate cyclase (GGDEF)-like protein/PAS domain S-box-containing protein
MEAKMLAWLNGLLVNSESFMPHGTCYLWLPSILWLHILSDATIALAYFSIPFALWYFVNKRTDLAYRWVFVLFGLFILLCGTTHLMSIWTIWHPDYWLDGLIKLATALVSIATALLIWPLLPKLLALPSPQALKTNETYLRAIFNATPDALLISDAQGKITMVNQQMENLFGYRADELVGQSIEFLLPERLRSNHPALRTQFLETPFTTTRAMGRVVLGRKKDNTEFDVDISLSPIQTGQGLFIAASLRDVTLQKQAQAALQASEGRFRGMANNLSIIIWITDEKGDTTFVNQYWRDLTGLDSGQLDYEEWVKTIHPEDRGTTFTGYYQDTQSKVPITTEYRVLGVDGTWHWILDKAIPTYDEGGNFTGYLGSGIDITERKLAEEKIKKLAFYDPLTQLPNRSLLVERLKYGVEIARREGRQLALLMLDLDRFKAVNDSFGHIAGDNLLQQVADRLKPRLRAVDTIARWGGDEFIVLLENITHPDDAGRVAEEILVVLGKPFLLQKGDDVRIGASIGISLYPQHADNPDLLLDQADAALYLAKDQGRGHFAYFSEDITRAIRERIALEVRLHKAIEQQELRVFYQPQIDIASDRIVGAEALVRWQDPNEGLIPPSVFIPIAEESSLIVKIGEWVLRETCRQGRLWLDRGLPPITLAVNVSPHQFRRSDINALVAKVLAETGFPAGQLELEITESGLMENQQNATNILNNLHDQGIRLAIDDFGTGFSSLAYLKHFPLDVLKIDKSFIDEIPHNKDDMEIAATIVAMGHILGFKVLAEGVETQEQLSFLQDSGCDMYQGYFKSRPIPAEEFSVLLGEG